MDHALFDSLPIGSIVTHSSTEHTCAYRKVKGGTGWAVVGKNYPWARPEGDHCKADANLTSGANLTLVRMGKGKEPSAKDQRITELEARLEASRSFVAGLEHENGELRAERDRLRQVIRAARGTLGAN